MKQNVLVFPCGSEIGLEVYKSLCFSTHFNLTGGSSVNDHGRFIYENYIGGIPEVSSSNFISGINTIIRKLKIDFIIPAHDSVVLKLSQAKANGQLNCDVITSPVETCEVSRSKLKTYNKLKHAIPTPRVYKTREELKASDLPIFMKPDVGQGSKGTYVAKTLEDVAYYLKNDPSLILLEYLPGTEYTVDCFTDKKGKLLFCEGRKRQRTSNGISVNSFTVNDDRFANVAHKINGSLRFRGVWFFQVKESANGELVLMEIAPRIAGTMGLVRCKGVNLVLLSLFDALGYDVGVFENNYSMVIDRALQNSYNHDIEYNHVYLDLDDLVIFEDKVNPAVMAFVYQCVNKGIKIHLLTKHKKNLSHTLELYRLAGIFDELILVQNDNEKGDFIKEKDAIFIDDSFAERKKIHDSLGVPVFDAHMIESLME